MFHLLQEDFRHEFRKEVDARSEPSLFLLGGSREHDLWRVHKFIGSCRGCKRGGRGWGGGGEGRGAGGNITLLRPGALNRRGLIIVGEGSL